MAEKTKSYIEAVTRLRQIVSEIEQGELDVDILSDRVKEASRLLRICKEKLYKVDEEVKKVLDNLEE
ncbi:MAG: exodeoxyribonuclease VII small subunit [Tannerellaceae bacterium]|nr:exodeoxyribonuclease VII small subunit [Tannerellaceae bacterium]